MSKRWLNYVIGWWSAVVFMVLMTIAKSKFLFNGSSLTGTVKIIGIILCVFFLIAGLLVTFGVDD